MPRQVLLSSRAALACLGVVAPAVAVLLAPALAFASSANACDPSEFCFPIHGYYILDFAAFVGILVYFGRKPIAAMLDKRYVDIAKEIAAAKELRDAAQAKYDEYRKRIEGLEEELARTLAEVRQGTEIEMKRLLDDAQAQVDKITAEEQLRLEQESKRLREELQRDAATLALQLAESKLQSRLDASGQQRLLERALHDLEALPQRQSGPTA